MLYVPCYYSFSRYTWHMYATNIGDRVASRYYWENSEGFYHLLDVTISHVCISLSFRGSKIRVKEHPQKLCRWPVLKSMIQKSLTSYRIGLQCYVPGQENYCRTYDTIPPSSTTLYLQVNIISSNMYQLLGTLGWSFLLCLV